MVSHPAKKSLTCPVFNTGSREHKIYHVVVYRGMLPTVHGDVQASSPCKAAELFIEDRKLMIPDEPFKITVKSHVGLKFMFTVMGE